MSRSCGSARTNAILRRLLAYARTRLGWEGELDAVRDARRRPQISTPVIVRALEGEVGMLLHMLQNMAEVDPNGYVNIVTAAS